MKKGEVLLFQFTDEEKAHLIKKTLESLNITCRILPADAYKETVGALFGMKGLPTAKTQSSFSFPHEVMLFNNLIGKRLDEALDALASAGVPKVQYKAVLTPTNSLWTLARLCQQLQAHGA